MKFRRSCFTVLALLTIAFAIVWIVSGLNESEKVSTANEYEEAGRTIGQGIGVTMIACITIPFFALFSLLAWRNDVGLRTERRHQEQIAALKGER